MTATFTAKKPEITQQETQVTQVSTETEKAPFYELTMAEVMQRRRSIKAAIGTANLVKGDQVCATKVEAETRSESPKK